MPQTQYCTVNDVKAELGTPNATDDVLISAYIDRACAALERELGLSFAATTLTARVYRPGAAVWLRPGVLRVRLGLPHITTVTALSYRTDSPLNSWLEVDATALDVATEDHIWWVDAYTASACTTGPVWAKVTGTAGYSAGAYPPDLVQLATGWAAYLYRSKDAPLEKTANPMLGTVTIPQAFPVKLVPMLARWRNCEVA